MDSQEEKDFTLDFYPFSTSSHFLILRCFFVFPFLITTPVFPPSTVSIPFFWLRDLFFASSPTMCSSLFLQKNSVTHSPPRPPQFWCLVCQLSIPLATDCERDDFTPDFQGLFASLGRLTPIYMQGWRIRGHCEVVYDYQPMARTALLSSFSPRLCPRPCCFLVFVCSFPCTNASDRFFEK